VSPWFQLGASIHDWEVAGGPGRDWAIVPAAGNHIAEETRPVHIPGGEVGTGPMTFVLGLHPYAPARSRWRDGMMATAETSELPILYMLENGERHVLNYALRGDTIVADRVLRRAVLVVGGGEVSVRSRSRTAFRSGRKRTSGTVPRRRRREQ
jgi:hypothetical protein